MRMQWQEQSESQREGKDKRNCTDVGGAETSGELAERRRLQWKNLNILGLLKRNAGPQCHKVSSWQGRQSRLCQKEKKQSHLSRSPNREVGESQGERVPHLGEKKGIRAVAWRGNGGLHS